jgi:hypothetical protein
MRLENIGLTVSVIGLVSGVLLITCGVLLYLMNKKSKRVVATAARAIGIGTMITMFSIPFYILDYLLAGSAGGGVNLAGTIILSVFLGSPLLAMGIASYIGLNQKAQEMLTPEAEDKIRYIF